MKQTKNPIDRQMIERELYEINRSETGIAAISLAVVTVMFVALAAALSWFTAIICDNSVLRLILMIMICSLCLVPSAVFLVSLIRALSEKKLLRNRAIEIVMCELLHKDERLSVRLRANRPNMLNLYARQQFYFSGFTPREVAGDTYQLGAVGDEYYIVHYKGKDRIKLLYSAKMYECKLSVAQK
jgi:hypothetical protein